LARGRTQEEANALARFLRQTTASLFSQRNSFAPGRPKPMAESDKALFFRIYRLGRRVLTKEDPKPRPKDGQDSP
jgi:hypothetical protein